MVLLGSFWFAVLVGLGAGGPVGLVEWCSVAVGGGEFEGAFFEDGDAVPVAVAFEFEAAAADVISRRLVGGYPTVVPV